MMRAGGWVPEGFIVAVGAESLRISEPREKLSSHFLPVFEGRRSRARTGMGVGG